MKREPASVQRDAAHARAHRGSSPSGTAPAARHARRAAAALLVLSIVWGYNWVIMKQAAAYAGPFQFSALRTVFATVALFALLALRRQPMGLTAWRWVLLLGLLQTGAFTALSQWALVAGAAGKTAVLAYTMPFWLLVLARIFLHERLRGWQWLTVLLAAFGLLLILAPWRAQGTLASSVLAIASGLAWAAGSVVVKMLRRRSDIGLLSLTAWQMAFGAIALVIVDLAVPAPPMHGALWLVVAVAYLAVIGTGLSWLLWMYVLDNLPAGIAGLGSLAIPAVGVIAAWLQLGERPPAHEIAGMLVIAAALGLLALAGIARGHRHPPVRVRR
jgi:drug/metabolite transporter (DMT)-like permease